MVCIRSGMQVITTCSPKHFDLVKRLGADLVYDYVSALSADHRCPLEDDTSDISDSTWRTLANRSGKPPGVN